MRRSHLLALCLCFLLVACGGNAPADGDARAADAAVATQPAATATIAPTPTIRPTATATAKPPTATTTRPRPTPTATLAPTVAPTPVAPRVALTSTVAEATGRCRVGLPAGFVAAATPPDTWSSSDRFISVSLAVPEGTTNPTLAEVTARGVAGVQSRLTEYQEEPQVRGAGTQRVDFTGRSGDKRAWGSLYVRQFGLDFCQLTVIATAGTTALLDPLTETMTGSLAAVNPRPAPVAYLALGDSYAAGVGAADPATGGYAPRFVAAINDGGVPPIGVKNLAIPGATSADFFGDWASAGKAGKSPLADAVRALEAGGITLVTIEIGGNDILRLLKPGQPCAEAAIEGEPCLAAMREALRTMTAPNLPLILGAIVEAAQPGTRILILNYPNAFSTGRETVAETRTDRAIGELNGLIAGNVRELDARAAARGVTVTPVDLAPLFAGQAGKLTHILDQTPDIHPTDAGYIAIAEALLRAYKK
ncbi:MAG: hypothetical protein AVDCRST_MAG18-2367 [uncultured Thermomicrobiales bacterium]|uniref:SGNH hydrolase-type esterase domain-containing protein n=1 Tax=uncultured Thermomicrobiales bacterium TaxID=1645740 RepID=A0A6J4VDA1_9BACT|nr:MAG: hypothetical protein AVDCRST_MAG18-2367 [uncultured Thermomicrobiales bacterium]